MYCHFEITNKGLLFQGCAKNVDLTILQTKKWVKIHCCYIAEYKIIEKLINELISLLVSSDNKITINKNKQFNPISQTET